MSRLALEALAKTIGQTKHPERLFTDWQSLLGFNIGWVLHRLFEKLCGDHGIDRGNSEIIMMRAAGLTECHLHRTGASTFMVLGPQQGMPRPEGGTYLGDHDQSKIEQKLEFHRHKVGDIFSVPAGTIHAFAADPGGSLTLIGVVSPKIRRSNEFDVVPFDYIDRSDPTRVLLATM